MVDIQINDSVGITDDPMVVETEIISDGAETGVNDPVSLTDVVTTSLVVGPATPTDPGSGASGGADPGQVTIPALNSSYPTVGGHRMLLDCDGSMIFSRSGTTLTALDRIVLNNESVDAVGPSTSADVECYLLALPELRDITGLYLGIVQPDPTDWVDVLVEGSANTTTGADGTWSLLYGTNRVRDGDLTGWWGHTAPGDYRRYVRVIPPATGLKVLRVTMTPQSASTVWSLSSLHCFGQPSLGANPHRLEFWHPWLNQRVPPSYLDWGNVSYSSGDERPFRVHNLSYSKTARDTLIRVDALTDANPSVPRQMFFAYEGGGWSNTITVPELLPGAISPVITLRRVTPSSAAAGPWAVRLRAAATWIERLA